MKNLTIDFSQFEDSRQVHEYLAAQLSFPEYYGKNLDALYDVLSTYHENLWINLIPSGKEFEDGFMQVFQVVSFESAYVEVGIKAIP